MSDAAAGAEGRPERGRHELRRGVSGAGPSGAARPGDDSAAVGAGALEGRLVSETPDGDLLRLADWEADTPGLVCGITTAAAGTFGVSEADGDALLDAYGGLANRLGFPVVAVPRQVHGRDVAEASLPVAPAARSVWLAGRVDGLVTGARGLLLASTAADCVPIHVHDRKAGILGLFHAGWRGVAAGILAAGLERARARGADTGRVRVHFGPAICGACYEVDRPVLEALGLAGDRALVDLRGLLAGQALEAGIRPDAVTCSAWCTRCAADDLHSHRGSGGQAGRMAAFIGLRAGAASD